LRCSVRKAPLARSRISASLIGVPVKSKSSMSPAFAGAGLYGAIPCQAVFAPRLVAAVAARRVDCLQLFEIKLGDRLQPSGSRGGVGGEVSAWRSPIVIRDCDVFSCLGQSIDAVLTVLCSELEAVLRPVACDRLPGARARGQGTETLAQLGGFAAVASLCFAAP
jgi:hypothetical protein